MLNIHHVFYKMLYELPPYSACMHKLYLTVFVLKWGLRHNQSQGDRSRTWRIDCRPWGDQWLRRADSLDTDRDAHELVLSQGFSCGEGRWWGVQGTPRAATLSPCPPWRHGGSIRGGGAVLRGCNLKTPSVSVSRGCHLVKTNTITALTHANNLGNG